MERRVAWHAALADTARLRIVDLLALGDRSPGELRSDLGIASNLLAHHLGVLDAEGIIARTRSEGDRRRNYVRLADHTAVGTGTGLVLQAERVVFVCTGNSARSPLAAAIWAQIDSSPGASSCIRASEKRTVGPATVMTPIGAPWAGVTVAAIALRPAVKVSTTRL